MNITRTGVPLAAALALFALSSTLCHADEFVDAVRTASPSVVRISAIKEATSRITGKTATVSVPASGVILSADGYIASCATAVARGRPQRLVVTLRSGKSYSAKVAMIDLKTDLILLKIAKTGLSPIKIAKAPLPGLGQWVLTMGNPFGLSRTHTDALSVNAGVVSAIKPIDRHGFLSKRPVIVVDITINPGASGGALLDTKGRLLGICGRLLRNAQTRTQLSFAVPASTAVAMLKRHLARKTPEPDDSGYLGVYILDSDKGTKGAFIQSVVPDSPADKAGLKADDLVVAMDSVATNNGRKLITELNRVKSGATVRLTVLRKKERITLTATLGTPPVPVLK